MKEDTNRRTSSSPLWIFCWSVDLGIVLSHICICQCKDFEKTTMCAYLSCTLHCPSSLLLADTCSEFRHQSGEKQRLAGGDRDETWRHLPEDQEFGNTPTWIKNHVWGGFMDPKPPPFAVMFVMQLNITKLLSNFHTSSAMTFQNVLPKPSEVLYK